MREEHVYFFPFLLAYAMNNLEKVTFSFRLYANLLALLLRFETVIITLAASVPESRTAAVVGVVVPLDREIAAGTSVLRQSACSTGHGRHREATLEVLPLRFFDSVWAASELRSVAHTSGEVQALGWGPFIRTAFEFRILTSAACENQTTRRVISLTFAVIAKVTGRHFERLIYSNCTIR